MPEGDSVLRAARTLDHALARQTIRRSEFRVPRYANADLSGQEILDVKARGKHMLHTSGGLTLQTHFMMDGKWMLYKPGARFAGPAHLIRVILETAEWVAVGYELGIVEIFPTIEEARRLEGLGPDVLGADWDADEAVRRLLQRPDRAIGDALLDQTRLAGIGNIYKCESLFFEHLYPWARVDQIADPRALVERARKLMQYSVQTGRQCTTTMPREPFYVYNRTGRACRRCRTRIEMQRGQAAGPIADGDSGRALRVTWWCPRCQPAPT